MWSWFRRKISPIVEITHDSVVGIYLVPGAFRVVSISYDTDGNASITLLKEDRYLRRYEAGK